MNAWLPANWISTLVSPSRRPFIIKWLWLGAFFYFVASGLDRIVLGYPMDFLLLTPSIAILAGLMCGQTSRLQKLLGVLLIIVGCAAGIIYLTNLGDSMLNWLSAGIYTLRAAWVQWQTHLPGAAPGIPGLPQADVPLDISAYNLTLLELRSTASLAFNRVYNWLVALAAGSPIFDVQASSIIWSLIIWSLAVWAGWTVQKLFNPLLSAGPAVTLLAICLNFTRGDVRRLLPLLGMLGAWLAADFYTRALTRWSKKRVDFAEEIGSDIGLACGLVIISLVGSALLVTYIPEIHLEDISTWFDRSPAPASQQQEQVAKSLGLQNPTSQPSAFERQNLGSMPRQHLLGSGPELSQRAVMSVQVLSGGLTLDMAAAIEAGQISAPRYYWRAFTYDQYTGDGWRSTAAYEVNIPAGYPVMEAEFPSQHILEQEVRLINANYYLYASGVLYSVDHVFRTAWRPIPGEEDSRPTHDFFGAHTSTKTYKAISFINLPDVAALNSAHATGPDWLRHRYARLDPGIPQRVLDLAKRLADAQDTDYQRALAIEAYLRQIPYTLDLPAPPAGRDIVDYYLFDLKRGYCDYAASAMVVLARAAGMPARLVMGYASGKYDAANHRYLVTEADAHSWPEIYFEGIGWVEFEPTSGLPERRLIPITPLPTQELEAPESLLQRYKLPLAQIGLVTAIFLACLGLAVVILNRWRWSRLAPGSQAAIVFQRYHKRAWQTQTSGYTPGYTPLELANAVQTVLERTAARLARLPVLAQLSRWAAQRASVGVVRLTELYNQAVYAAPQPTAAQVKNLYHSWESLRSPLTLMARLARFAGKLKPAKQPSKSETPSHDKPGKD